MGCLHGKSVLNYENKISTCFTLMSVILAKTKFVKASPTVILAPQPASTKHFIGCSPIAVADPA